MSTEEINKLCEEWSEELDIREKHIRLMIDDLSTDDELDTLLNSLNSKDVDFMDGVIKYD